jgi:hypothetical protein
MQPAMPQAAIIQAKLAASDDIKATTGQYDASLGQQARTRVRQGDQRASRSSRTWARSTTSTTSPGAALRRDDHPGHAPSCYDTKRIVRILGEDGEPTTS